VDKVGEAYIPHPLRVMQQMDSDEARVVAVLHDVVEDNVGRLRIYEQKGFLKMYLRRSSG
jgi:(p)ppGpp synthase/HD superfamily hydrolase